MVDLGGSVVFVDVCRHAALNLEEIVCVAVDFVCWCCGETEDECIEIVKDRPVFLENGAVCLVNDDEIEMRGRVHADAVTVLDGVDGVENSRVGGEYDTRVEIVLVFAKVAAGGVRQVFLVASCGLGDEGHTVRKKEHIFDLAGPYENID